LCRRTCNGSHSEQICIAKHVRTTSVCSTNCCTTLVHGPHSKMVGPNSKQSERKETAILTTNSDRHFQRSIRRSTKPHKSNKNATRIHCDFFVLHSRIDRRTRNKRINSLYCYNRFRTLVKPAKGSSLTPSLIIFELLLHWSTTPRSLLFLMIVRHESYTSSSLSLSLSTGNQICTIQTHVCFACDIWARSIQRRRSIKSSSVAPSSLSSLVRNSTYFTRFEPANNSRSIRLLVSSLATCLPFTSLLALSLSLSLSNSIQAKVAAVCLFAFSSLSHNSPFFDTLHCIKAVVCFFTIRLSKASMQIRTSSSLARNLCPFLDRVKPETLSNRSVDLPFFDSSFTHLPLCAPFKQHATCTRSFKRHSSLVGCCTHSANLSLTCNLKTIHLPIQMHACVLDKRHTLSK
jgi:hypothetical protein